MNDRAKVIASANTLATIDIEASPVMPDDTICFVIDGKAYFFNMDSEKYSAYDLDKFAGKLKESDYDA